MTAADWIVAFLDLELEAVTGVRVGGARGGGETTDAPLIRDHENRPLIPGSSLKGSLRSAGERLLRSIDAQLACDVVSARCLGDLRGREPTDEELETLLCWICRLFGNPFQAGRLVVGDLVADTDQTVVRDGVAIDRRELKQASGLKYDYEVVPPGTVFTGRIRIDDPEPGDIGLVLSLLDLVDQGIVTLGGGASRGLGRLRYHRPPALAELRASAFVRGAAPEIRDPELERQQFAARIEAGSR
jgi:CRISPR-associated protein Csm3